MADEAKINLSVSEDIKKLGDAIRKVTNSIFQSSGRPATLGKRKKKTAQIKFKISPRKRKNLETAASRELLQKRFTKKAALVERQIKQAVDSVLIGLIGLGQPQVKVMSKTLGVAKPVENIVNGQLGSYVKSKKGAGEIGLVDPMDALNRLVVSLRSCITFTVTVTPSGPKVNFTFDQTQLLKRNPHPDTSTSEFYSWLSLVTGPQFVKRIPGYSFITTGQINDTINEYVSFIQVASELKFVEKLQRVARSPRSFSYAGDYAGLMLKNTRTGSRMSQAESIGGEGSNPNFSPSLDLDGYWDSWWNSVKQELNRWVRLIMFAVIRNIASANR